MVSGATPGAKPPEVRSNAPVGISPPVGEDQGFQAQLTEKRAIAQDELSLVEQRQVELRRIIDACNAALSTMAEDRPATAIVGG